jgi:hypothetical protein
MGALGRSHNHHFSIAIVWIDRDNLLPCQLFIDPSLFDRNTDRIRLTAVDLGGDGSQVEDEIHVSGDLVTDIKATRRSNR